MHPPGIANGPMVLKFGVMVGFEYGMLLFRNSRSKVKVKYPRKYAFYGPILVTGAKCGTIQDQGGSGGVLLAACQLILATCQKLENDRRPPLDRFPGVGLVPNSEKVLGRSIAHCIYFC